MTNSTKQVLIFALLAAVCLPHSASAQQIIRKVRYWSLLPPVEYDKPYTGELWITRLSSEEEIQNLCKEGKRACANTKNLPPGQVAPKCHIYMLTDKQLRAKGIGGAAISLRHELGHCNGWRGHDGGRKVYIDTHIDMPKLPASTRELPAYPPLVCVTPEWKQESCKARVPQS
jgi:hypothetical protein